MASKKITIDFWRVVMPDGEGTFADALNAADDLPDNDSRALTVHGAAVRLQSVRRTGSRRDGEMIRIRMDEVPVRASLSGEVEAFELDEDEGVGEETAFLYVPSLEVLVTQRNRFGVSASRMAAYVEYAADIDGVITLEPVIEPAAASRLQRMQRIRRFEVKVAGVHNAQTIKDANPGVSVKRMADLINDLSAVNFNMEVTMGHDSGSLDIATVRRVARNLLRVRDGTAVDVRKVEISGRSSDNEEILVDLIQDRMTETAEIELDDDRRLPYADRRGALREAYATRKSALQALFAVPEQ